MAGWRGCRGRSLCGASRLAQARGVGQPVVRRSSSSPRFCAMRSAMPMRSAVSQRWASFGASTPGVSRRKTGGCHLPGDGGGVGCRERTLREGVRPGPTPTAPQSPDRSSTCPRLGGASFGRGASETWNPERWRVTPGRQPTLAGFVDRLPRSSALAHAARSALMSEDLPVLGTPTTIMISGIFPVPCCAGANPPLSRTARSEGSPDGRRSGARLAAAPSAAAPLSTAVKAGPGGGAHLLLRGSRSSAVQSCASRGVRVRTDSTAAWSSSATPSPVRAEMSTALGPKWRRRRARAAAGTRSALFSTTTRRSNRPVCISSRSRCVPADESGRRASRTSMTKSTRARRSASALVALAMWPGNHPEAAAQPLVIQRPLDSREKRVPFFTFTADADSRHGSNKHHVPVLVYTH